VLLADGEPVAFTLCSLPPPLPHPAISETVNVKIVAKAIVFRTISFFLP
jgi:hypothetical protein